MPREVLEIVSLVELADTPGPKTLTKRGKAAKRGDSGYIADSAVRSAIEWRAVNMARDAYKASGYEVEYTGASKPYDLVVTKGNEVRRVEVKGSSGVATTVELTNGEVNNSRESTPTDLYVVDGIQWWRDVAGTVQADEGNARWWRKWSARDESLTAIRYRYKLPPGGTEEPSLRRGFKTDSTYSK
jgi:hypothetical protein